MCPTNDAYAPLEIVALLEKFVERAVSENGGSTEAVRPAHRIPFHWPPHPVSADFHVRTHEWDGRAEFEAYGETFEVLIAHTQYGVFGRVQGLWNEARGQTVPDVLAQLREGAEPLFQRQLLIGKTLGIEGRYSGTFSELSRLSLLKLLYCPDRDVAHEAIVAIETHASTHDFAPGLLFILRDRRHPHRRAAQWAALDLFEDLPSFCRTYEEQVDAVLAMRELIWDARDDFARTVYKAGVVMGGHVCSEASADHLIECLHAPSRIGRRSAIHAVFHLAEWMPERKPEILSCLRDRANKDPEPLLREFAKAMARDVERGEVDHVAEPVFPDED